MPNDFPAAQRTAAYSSGLRQKSSSSSLRSSHLHHQGSKKSGTNASSSAASNNSNNASSTQSAGNASAELSNPSISGAGASKNRNPTTETPKNHILPPLSFYDTFAIFIIFLRFPEIFRIIILVLFIFVLSPSWSTNVRSLLLCLRISVWPFKLFLRKQHSNSTKKPKLSSQSGSLDPDGSKDTKNYSHNHDHESSKSHSPTFITSSSFFKSLLFDFLFAIMTIYLTPILRNVVLVFSTAIVAASLGGGPHPIIHAVYATSVIEVIVFFWDRIQLLWSQDLAESSAATSSLGSISSSIDLTIMTPKAESIAPDADSKNKIIPQESQETLNKADSSHKQHHSKTENSNDPATKNRFIPEAASSLFSEIFQQSLSAVVASVASSAVPSLSLSEENDYTNGESTSTGIGYDFPVGLDGIGLGIDGGAARGGKNYGFGGGNAALDQDQSFNTVTSVANVIPNFIYFMKHYDWRTEFPTLIVQMIAIYVIWLSLKQYMSTSSGSGSSFSTFGFGNTEYLDYHYDETDGLDGNLPVSDEIVYRDVVEVNVAPKVAFGESSLSDTEGSGPKDSEDPVSDSSPSSGWAGLFNYTSPIMSANTAVNKRTALAFKRMTLTKSHQPLWATIAHCIVMSTNLEHLPGVKPLVEDDAGKGFASECFLEPPTVQNKSDSQRNAKHTHEEHDKALTSDTLVKHTLSDFGCPCSGVFVVYIFQTVVGIVVTNLRYPIPAYYSVRVNQVLWKQIVVKPLYLSETVMSVVDLPKDDTNTTCQSETSKSKTSDLLNPYPEADKSNESSGVTKPLLDGTETHSPNGIFIAVHGLPAGAIYEIDVYFNPKSFGSTSENTGTTTSVGNNEILIGHNSVCTNIPYEGYYQFGNAPAGSTNSVGYGYGSSASGGSGSTSGFGGGLSGPSSLPTGINGPGSGGVGGSGTVAPPPRPLSPVTTLLDSFTQMVTVLSQTRESTKKLKKDHSKRIASLKAEVEATRLKKESLDKSDERTRKRVEELHEIIATLEKDIETLHSEVGELEVQEKEVGKKYEAATQSYDAKMKSAMATRSREKQAEAKMRKQLDEVKADEEMLAGKRDKVKARQEKLEAEIEKVTKEVDETVEKFITDRKESREIKQKRRTRVATEFSDSIDKMEENVQVTQTKTAEIWAEVHTRSQAIQQAEQLRQSQQQESGQQEASEISPTISLVSPPSLQNLQSQQFVSGNNALQQSGYPLSTTHSIPLASQISSGGGIAPTRSFGSGAGIQLSSHNSLSGYFSAPLVGKGSPTGSLPQMSNQVSSHISGPVVTQLSGNMGGIGSISSPIAAYSTPGSLTNQHISGPISGPFTGSPPGLYAGYIPGTLTGPPIFPSAPGRTPPTQSPPNQSSSLNVAPSSSTPRHSLGAVGTPIPSTASLTSPSSVTGILGSSANYLSPDSLTSSPPSNKFDIISGYRTSPPSSMPGSLTSNPDSLSFVMSTRDQLAAPPINTTTASNSTSLAQSGPEPLQVQTATSKSSDVKIDEEIKEKDSSFWASLSSEALKSPTKSFKNLTITPKSSKALKSPKSPKSPKNVKSPLSPKFSIPAMATKLTKSASNKSAASSSSTNSSTSVTSVLGPPFSDSLDNNISLNLSPLSEGLDSKNSK